MDFMRITIIRRNLLLFVSIEIEPVDLNAELAVIGQIKNPFVTDWERGTQRLLSDRFYHEIKMIYSQV